MSDTPKTDSQTTWSESEGGVHKHIDGTGWLVDTDFARALERENNQLREALNDLCSICTCDRPAVPTPEGGVKAPGPHTERCVSSRAKKALALPSVQAALKGVK